MTTLPPAHEIVSEIEAERPRTIPGLLSHQEKDRLIERGMVGLYRWYLARSQATRNWNPDKSFNWRALRTDHSEDVNRVIEGYYAVEQYAPDYASQTISLTRSSHGRAHFQIRWGAEEARHADLWLNALLFLRRRTPQWLEAYAESLRARRYSMPWDDAFHMLFYALIQERATQLSYLNTAVVARGQSDKPELAGDQDPVLAEVAQTIAIDEAAHYNFFLEGARLFLYYYPARTLEALAEVIERFAMPALDIIPNAQAFHEAVYRTGIYGSARQYARDVLQAALDNLGIVGRRALVEGVKRIRQAPDEDGHLRGTAVFELLDYHAVQDAVRRLFQRIEQHEQAVGLADLNPTTFVPSGLSGIADSASDIGR